MPLSHAEVDAVMSVLWYTHAIRHNYEDWAEAYDERTWYDFNRGLFSIFARSNSQKWTEVMGPVDPTVRYRKISLAAMNQARMRFEESYRRPVEFALELAE